MQEPLTATRNDFRLTGIAINAAVLIITLAGVALVMFVRRPDAINDFAYVAIVATVVGVFASLLGSVSGIVWYLVWMIGTLVCDEINNWPDGDPELALGLGIMGMCAAPMIPIGYLVSFLKNIWKDRRHANAGAQ
jgi:hypothetical protein